MTSSSMPDGHWEVDRDDSVAVLRYDGGTRRTLGIDGAGQLAALLDERSRGPSRPCWCSRSTCSTPSSPK